MHCLSSGSIRASSIPGALFSLAMIATISASSMAAPVHSDQVVLLKFPYPYRAALTVASDTHVTSVETFTAVHTLINSRDRIPRGSRFWQLLFADPAIEARPEWQGGISGFGLPIADSCWFYHPVTGVYLSFDDRTGAPVPHIQDGLDFRQVVDGWIRRGWVDTLHTPGEGDISRAAVKSGLDWLAGAPHRRLRVWSNHTFTETPACLGPAGLSALPLVLKNIAKTFTMGLSLIGEDRFARRLAANPYPSPFPVNQRFAGRFLSFLLIVCLFWLLYCLLRPGARTLRNLSVGGMMLGVVLAVLYTFKFDFCEGDNPNSPLYSADLVRQAGFRYFWLLPGVQGYQPEISGTLRTPEGTFGQRHASLFLVQLDDGTQACAFSRCYLGDRGLRSLELLTETALSDLCVRGGMSILYTHWADAPKEVFHAIDLDGLARLRRYNEDGRIWVAPASRLLHFTFIRTFLEYSSRLEGGHRVIDVGRVAGPDGDSFEPALRDLEGLSFDSAADPPIEMRLAGRVVPASAYQTIAVGQRTVIRFSPTQEIDHAGTTPADATAPLR